MKRVVQPKLPAIQGFVEVDWGGRRLYQALAAEGRYHPGAQPEKRTGEKAEKPGTITRAREAFG